MYTYIHIPDYPNEYANADESNLFNLEVSLEHSIYMSIKEFNEKEGGELLIEGEYEDISTALLEDKDFMESIKRAREEMRRGEYLTYQEVFGD